MPDLLVARVRGSGRSGRGGHDHAGRAEAALQAVLLAERLLHGWSVAVRGQPFDRRDGLPPSACTASTVHDFTVLPSRWTVHAPHCDVSHATFVPVNPTSSRRKSAKSVLGLHLGFPPHTVDGDRYVHRPSLGRRPVRGERSDAPLPAPTRLYASPSTFPQASAPSAKALEGSASLDRLELLERLPAAVAVAQRAARRRAEEVLELRVRRAAVGAAEGPRLELDELRPAGSRGAGGAKPAARSFSRPSGVMRSVDHESSEITATSGSPPSSRTFAAIWSRMTSSAGQPRNVGVNSTRTRPSSTATSRTTPRSTSEITGISGSGISASASQTFPAVTMSHPRPSGAPSSSPPRAR